MLREPYALTGQSHNVDPLPLPQSLGNPVASIRFRSPLVDEPMARHTPTPPEPLALVGQHAYFIGIGGCGMSGLARMFLTRGCQVQGSDMAPSSTTRALAAQGIRIDFQQASDPLPDSCDLVVASAAIKPDHPQIALAKSRGIPTFLYAQALGGCMAGSTGIAISGTHGKSTTTAMLGIALVDSGLEPSVIVGATSNQLVNGAHAASSTPAGFRLGTPKLPTNAARPSKFSHPYAAGVLVAEACEYNRSFHNLAPTLACITSVEADHLDMYKDVGEIIESFRQFAAMLPPEAQGGKLLIAYDNAHRREVVSGAKCAVETIGFNPAADWVVSFDVPTRLVRVSRQGVEIASWCNTVPGSHNATNAATAFVLGLYVGADPKKLAESLAKYQGIDRRMQFLGSRVAKGDAGLDAANPVRIFDDYGHHPTEVDVTLQALREAEAPQSRNGRLICVFQPHQHSRTRHLLDEFAVSFSHADVVIVPEIYFVRDSEEERLKVTAGNLVDRLRARGVRAMHLHPFSAIVEQLETMCKPGDVIVTMGAGDVNRISQAYASGQQLDDSKTMTD